MNVRDASTFVVELTPPGRAAVAVVLVAGPRAKLAIEQWFTPITPWTVDGPTIGRVLLGRWGGENGEELVICRRGGDEFEIHCHGGAAAASGIMRRLIESGCEPLSWQDWLSKSQNDDIAAAARIALADAPTSRVAAILLDQYHGAFRRATDDACASLRTGDFAKASRIIKEMLKFTEVGLHLTSPWNVVIAGPPNVGKSSLINVISGYQRAIVSPIPGTTRDVVTVTTAIHGWPVLLADTAGLRRTSDELESAGVALATSAIQQADLVIVVSDASATDNASDIADLQLPPSIRTLRVVNKIDLVADHVRTVKPEEVIRISALTGQGIAELIDTIETALVPNAPSTGSAVPFTCAQIEALQAAREAIEHSDTHAAGFALKAMLATNATVP